jgi:hypothetical protein
MHATFATSGLPFTSPRPWFRDSPSRFGSFFCDVGDGAVGEHEVAGNDVGEVQHVRDHGVDLVRRERLGAVHGIARLT